MASNREREEIIKYILNTIDLTEDDYDELAATGLNTPRKILMAEDSVLAELTDKNVLTQVDLGEFMRFKRWMQSIKKEGNDLPKTIDGWKQDFTEDIWDAFCDTEMKSPPNPKPTPTPAPVLAPAPATAPNPTVQTTTTTTKSKNLVKVSLSDFPTFDGNQRNWKPFKREVTSTMGLLQLTSLLSVTKLTDVPSHTAKTISDPLYKTRNQEFYSILSKKLAKGTAASKVDVHLATMDGALVWKDICDYYDFGGDKESRITSLIGDLTKHYLYPESSGGYDTYYNRFDEKCQELDLAGIQVPSAIKKTLFLEGIKDRAYEAVKDTCASVDYESAVDKLRTKAIALGKANSRSYPRRSNKKARKGDYDDDYDDDHGSEQEDYDEQESYSDEHEDYDPRRPSSFSSDVWESMTQANRKWILKHKEKEKESSSKEQSYGFPDAVWAQMSPANRQWIMDRQNKEKTVDYGKQYSKDDKGIQEGGSNSRAIGQSDTEENKPKSIFRGPAKRK